MAVVPAPDWGRTKSPSRLVWPAWGEVYKVTDTNLKRAVAIKVLPDAVASDAERMARFQREAEVLASLNHPNIAAILCLLKSQIEDTALHFEGCNHARQPSSYARRYSRDRAHAR